MAEIFSYTGWTPTFSEEFDSLSLHDGKAGRWKTSFAWGDQVRMINGEHQAYVDAGYRGAGDRALGIDPFQLGDGVLTIEARQADASVQPYLRGQTYTSGLLTTEASFAMTYGYVEYRARMPAGQGLSAGLWLLPVDQSSPAEIDVAEMVSRQPTQLTMNTHPSPTTRPVDLTVATVPDMTSGFHTYGMEWNRDNIIWYFDGIEMARAVTQASMHGPMYLLANLAVGGAWPGDPLPGEASPGSMQIDYIRAWSRDPAAAPAAPAAATDTGTPDSDLFVVRPGQGQRIIADFQAGAGTGDAVKLEHTGFSGIDGVLRALRQDGADTELALGNGDAVIFRNRRTTDFAADDFRLPFEPPATRKPVSWRVGTTGRDVLTGDARDTYVDGGAGADTLAGGLGDDTYVVDNIGDVVTEAAGAGIDTVKSYLAAIALPDRVENLRLVRAVSASGLGNGLDNRLEGGAGDDRLDGGAGGDRLTGGAGRDTFTVVRGQGDDTITDFQTGTDRVRLIDTGLADFAAIQAAMTQVGSDVRLALGNDQILIFGNIDKGSFTAADFALVTMAGASAPPAPAASRAPTRRLYGGNGAEVVTGTAADEMLNGGPGADTLTGGGGDDTYVVDTAADRVIETAGGGVDTINAWTSYTLASHVENLKLEGSYASTGAGNGLDNRLLGSAGTNVLRGYAGNDVLIGAAGNDTLIGGTGRDVFVAGGPTDGVDVVVDFDVGLDVVDLRPALAAIGYTGSTPFADGRLRLQAEASGVTAILLDRDGAGTAVAQKILIIDLIRPEEFRPDQTCLF